MCDLATLSVNASLLCTVLWLGVLLKVAVTHSVDIYTQSQPCAQPWPQTSLTLPLSLTRLDVIQLTTSLFKASLLCILAAYR